MRLLIALLLVCSRLTESRFVFPCVQLAAAEAEMEEAGNTPEARRYRASEARVAEALAKIEREIQGKIANFEQGFRLKVTRMKEQASSRKSKLRRDIGGLEEELEEAQQQLAMLSAQAAEAEEAAEQAEMQAQMKAAQTKASPAVVRTVAKPPRNAAVAANDDLLSVDDAPSMHYGAAKGATSANASQKRFTLQLSMDDNDDDAGSAVFDDDTALFGQKRPSSSSSAAAHASAAPPTKRSKTETNRAPARPLQQQQQRGHNSEEEEDDEDDDDRSNIFSRAMRPPAAPIAPAQSRPQAPAPPRTAAAPTPVAATRRPSTVSSTPAGGDFPAPAAHRSPVLVGAARNAASAASAMRAPAPVSRGRAPSSGGVLVASSRRRQSDAASVTGSVSALFDDNLFGF
jgi:hypothetical protein